MKCQICKSELDGHLECEACNILIGEGHESSCLYEYRGVNICGECRSFWQRKERITGMDIPWWEFRTVKPKGRGRPC